MGAMGSNAEHTAKNDQFLRLYAQHHKRIFAFIFSLVPKRSDAEDIMQQTSVALWDMFDRYQAGTDFVAWSTRIAKYRVLQFRSGQAHHEMRLKEAAFQAILNQTHQSMKDADDRIPALEGCLKKLKREDLEIIRLRYEKSFTIKKVAEHLNRPVHGMYKVLARIHAQLLLCVQRQLSVRENAL